MRLQTPPGLRKSGMPDSVEIPAPVKTTARRAPSIMSLRRWRDIWDSRRMTGGQPAPRLPGVGRRRYHALGSEPRLGGMRHRLSGDPELLVEPAFRRRGAEMIEADEEPVLADEPLPALA